MKFKIGFIGAGVMAGTIIDRMLASKQFSAAKICAFDISTERRQELAAKKIYIPKNINELVSSSDIALLAVKPQNYTQVLADLDTTGINNLASIMAGVKINSLKSKLANKNAGIARIMPNTPAAIGEGISAVCFDGMGKEYKDYLIKILSACGEVIKLTEEKFDAFTCICGSGPAYVYMIMDAMIKAGCKGGLTADESKKMAAATLIGSAKFAALSSTPLDLMVEKVCSKGGTTIEAVQVFKQKGLQEILIEGIDACRMRSADLSENS